jgi:GT2 family glycosyltransferase
MNYEVERSRNWRGRLRELGDRLTGGGIRAQLHRLLSRSRHLGDRLTGAGLRSLSKRVVTNSLRSAMVQPFLKALGHGVLQPFPSFSAWLYRLATDPDRLATAVSASASGSPPQVSDHSLLVNSLYESAFGHPADGSSLAYWVHELESGTSVESAAEQLVRSTEFQTRHGSSEEVDINYLRTIYRDGLRCRPDLDGMALWLAKGKNGATRAKVLTAVAKRAEALERILLAMPDGQATYRRWVAVNDSLGNADRAAIRAHIAGLPFRPLISVVMPLSKTSEAAFCESFNSVITQLYPYWELCLAIDPFAVPLLSAILRDWTTQDFRIKVTKPNKVESAATSTNAALSLATGEFVTFIRAGNILAEHALYEFAFALGGDDRPDIVYSDHDHVTADGHRANPWFKPGWDPDLLLAQDYLSDSTVYRRSLIEAVGCLRVGFEGAEFHDLALRATAATAPDRILHVPAILCHSRDGEKSVHSKSALPGLRAADASCRAVRSHLDSRGYPEAVVERAPQIPSTLRIVWPLPESEPSVSVIVPTLDRPDLLAQCVDGILHRTDYYNLEVLIVDNGSVEPATLTLFDHLTSSDGRVSILAHPGPFNYSALNNAAAREAKGEVLLLLNSDIDVIDSGWLRELVSHAIRPDVGIVGAKLLYANEQIQHGGIVLGPTGQIIHVHRLANRNDPGYRGQLALARTLSAVTGACAAIRREVFFEVGGLDEVNLAMAFNDIDLCLRVGDYGYRVVWTPFAELFHLESASPGLDGDPAKRSRLMPELQYMQETWGSLMESADPFYNPNLLFAGEYFEVPSAPRRQKPWQSVFEEYLKLEETFSASAGSCVIDNSRSKRFA